MTFIRKAYIQKETDERNLVTKDALDQKVGSVETTLRERVSELEAKVARLESIVSTLPTVKDTAKNTTKN
jgi:hypothetical protein